jgi:hypothetical protein
VRTISNSNVHLVPEIVKEILKILNRLVLPIHK